MTEYAAAGQPVDDGWVPLEDAVSRDLFKAEVQAWAQRIGVEPKEVHIRPMTRKWGSCSTAGRLTFSEELLTQPAEFRRRVIVEELLHLKVPNHGKLFKALLRSYLALAAEETKDPHKTGDRAVLSMLENTCGSGPRT